MQRIVIIFSILILFTWNFINAQNTFAKIIKNTSGNGSLHRCIKTIDGKLISVGQLTYSLLATTIIKFDTTGNFIVKKQINSSSMQGSDIVQAKDSGYLMLCNTFLNSGDFCFIKLDKNFNIQWSKLVGGNNYEQGNAVVQSKDKGYLAVGSTNSFGLGGTTSDVYVVKLDSSGNLQWTKTYGGANMDAMFDIIESDSNTYVMAGQTMSYGAGATDIYLIKIDSLGNIIWTKTIGGIADDFGRGSILKDKNYLIVTGATNTYTLSYPNASYIFKIPNDTSKNLKWAVSFERAYIGEGHWTLHLNYKEEYVGIFNFPSGSTIPTAINGYAFSIDSLGVVNWVYRQAVANSYFIGLALLPNHSYILNGTFAPAYSATSQKNFIQKADQNGIGCLPTTTVAYAYVGGIVGSGGSITSVNQGTIANFYPTIIDDGIDSTICYCPNIPVSIQQTPVGCYSSGSVTLTPTSPGNYTYFWSPPISATNTASNLSAGNYTVIVMDSTGCKKTSVVTITNNLNLPLSITGNTLLCSGKEDTLTLNGASACTWNTGESTLSILIQPNITTTYTVVGVSGTCTNTAAVTVSVVSTPTVTVTPQLYTIGIGDTIQIQASGASNYLWIPATGLNNPNVANPIFSPTTTTEYCVIGSESSNTCSDSVCIKIQVEETCSNIRIPNVFTPNNDNINDTWGIEFPCPQTVGNFHLLVFNRWGVKLYEADKPNAKWDGRSLSGEPVPTGTYYYVAEFIINPAQGGKKQEAKGYFTLMR